MDPEFLRIFMTTGRDVEGEVRFRFVEIVDVLDLLMSAINAV